MDSQKTTTTFPAFNRYGSFTDLQALNDWSAKPLRKSVRVNTLKVSVADFLVYGKKKGWELTPVPWCKEAFFINRENREEALGRDELHLFGGFYMQESASMLPAELLGAEPGDSILDMSAAPGSKTTEIGAKMEGRGVVLANDIQEKRLWTLKNAIHRSGVINVIVTKKVGQWFAKHMTERFDRVLCDAPCTAQGTVRKDSDALRYCSVESIEKMARLQFQLLESAIHSTKVGGRIVYSTCTLTPEENEGVILQILERFPDQLQVVDPRTLNIAPDGYWDAAINDSITVQKSLTNPNPNPNPLPLLRLWPQTYDTEGFFSAVLQKTAPTKNVEPMDQVPFQEKELPKSRRKDVEKIMQGDYGTTFLQEHERLMERGEMLILTNQDVAYFPLPLLDYSLGIPFGKRLKDGRVLLDHETATLRGHEATTGVITVSDADCEKLLNAHDIDCAPELSGRVVILHNGRCIGLGLAKEGRLKNNLPRQMVRFS